MLNYLFLIFLFILWILILKILNNDFCSPSVLFTTGFMVSGFVFVINTTSWGHEIHFNTIVIICSAIVTVFLGELFARMTSIRKIRRTGNAGQKSKPSPVLASFYFSKKTAFLLGVLLIIFIVLQFRDISYIKNLYGQGSFFLDTYRQFSVYSYYGVFGKGMDVITLSVGYIAILAYSNGLVHKRRHNSRYLALLILCIIYFALSSNRITIIYFLLTLLIMWLIQYAYGNRWKYVSKESFNKVVKIIGVLILMFLLLGTLTGKTQSQDSLFQNVSIYVGSSIPALDVWLQDFSYDISNFGERTLFGITNLFKYIGIDFAFTEERNAPFVFIGDTSKRTNIYTGLKALLNDYSYFGMYMILFFEGALFYKLYLKCKKDLSNGRFTFVLLYAYIITLFSLTTIAERIIVTLIAITTVLFLIITIWGVKKIESRTKNITDNNLYEDGIKTV